MAATAVKSSGNAATAEPAEPGFEPVPYYSPKVTDERFLILSSGHMRRFHAGRFVAHTPDEERSVRAALRRFGPDAADRWRGDDMNKEWVSKKGDFRTRNEAAREDYETYRDK